MNTIACAKCGEEIEISSALQGQIEAQVLAAAHEQHARDLQRVKQEVEAAATKVSQAAIAEAKHQADAEREIMRRSLGSEAALFKQQAEADLAMERKRLEAEAETLKKQLSADRDMKERLLSEDAEAARLDAKKLRDQLTELMQQLSAANRARETAEFQAQQKFAEQEARLREDVSRAADERHRLNEAAKDKTIQDMQKAMEDMQRKAAQGSQQLQGEIMELDFEATLADSFRDDLIEPIAKGVKGGDVRQTVRSGRGTICGVMLWEIKRTKNWTDGWTAKLKEDLRSEKANVPIIVTEAMPKNLTEDIGLVDGVWVCKPSLAVMLGTLLRKSLLDVGRERAIGVNRTTSAEALYGFVTSHEFVQQIEVMVETYHEMSTQIIKERVAYEKLWAQREKQAQRLMVGTATIIGSMQGHIGAASMPRIKGMELLDAPEDTEPVPQPSTLVEPEQSLPRDDAPLRLL